MNSYYDDSLIKYADNLKIKYTIISDQTCYVENINRYFPFLGERIDFSKLNNTKFVDSNQKSISCDVIRFIKELIDERICSKNEVVIYIGDNLTNNCYEFHLNDLLTIIPFMVNEIPEHHYLLFMDFKKIIYISFEDEIKFGTIN